MSNFITNCINGYSLVDEIHDFIDTWHESDSNLELHAYLGLSQKEYALFLEDEVYLNLIVTSRRKERSIVSLYEEAISMAARSNNVEKSERLERWLKSENLW